MLRSFLLVGIGGGMGSMLRYGLNLLARRYWPLQPWPLATFVANMVGCLFIGLLYGMAARQGWLHRDYWLLLATGLCGGLTTFSTFSLDQEQMVARSQHMMALTYGAASVALGIFLCKIGVLLTEKG